jgi:glyoxylase-like metal-dependent hydrolase (beta-lactamase superfamily II)
MKTNYKITVLSMGKANVPAAEVYWMTKLFGWEKLTFWSFLLESNNRKILLNTGFPQNYSALKKLWTTWAQEAMNEPGHEPIVTKKNWIVNSLAAKKIKPEEIDDVLITPITAYATGGLDQFPNANLWISKKGWIDFHAPDPEIPQLPRNILFPNHILNYLVAEKNAHRIKLLSDKEIEFLPGIKSWFCGGHHRSSMLFKVNTKKGIVGLTDAIFKYRNYEENIPLGLSESVEEHHRLFAKMKREVDMVLPLYDPELENRHPSLTIG